MSWEFVLIAPAILMFALGYLATKAKYPELQLVYLFSTFYMIIFQLGTIINIAEENAATEIVNAAQGVYSAFIFIFIAVMGIFIVRLVWDIFKTPAEEMENEGLE